MHDNDTLDPTSTYLDDLVDAVAHRRSSLTNELALLDSLDDSIDRARMMHADADKAFLEAVVSPDDPDTIQRAAKCATRASQALNEVDNQLAHLVKLRHQEASFHSAIHHAQLDYDENMRELSYDDDEKCDREG